MKRNHGWQQGFTLVELMMVMVIVALVLNIGVRGWLAQQQAITLEQQARQLLHFMSGVQMSAYWHNRNEALWLFRQPERWCVGSGEPPLQCPPDGNRTFTRPEKTVALVETTSERLVFYGVRNTSQSGHITLGNGAGRVRLVVSVRGRLRLCGESGPLLAIPAC
ncbi:prepilin peptidase-dependent protein [Musicola paradisiaca]|uniref:Prepilin-type N-terminal cleavage/methylation domain-containing protein n=1 Tax=Musicola paradisiaca (strain Ech703) TaxID=579405 RepID=C6CC28_MUSP7|nr:prepilin peptidase-dependent protein [Musicola paradisiaca]ACS86788.1 conserved hypothetical protein [Musicola paradisiaca Ech703]